MIIWKGFISDIGWRIIIFFGGINKFKCRKPRKRCQKWKWKWNLIESGSELEPLEAVPVDLLEQGHQLDGEVHQDAAELTLAKNLKIEFENLTIKTIWKFIYFGTELEDFVNKNIKVVSFF